MNSHIKKILKEIERQGLEVLSLRTKKHLKVKVAYKDRTAVIVTGCSPSDHRAFLNARRNIKHVARRLKGHGKETRSAP